MTIGELYEKLGQLDGEQMQGDIYFYADDDLSYNERSRLFKAEFDGEDLILSHE